MAYSTGKALGLPTINVDSCVVEALCISNCNAKMVILNAINEMFDMIHKINKGDDERESDSEGKCSYVSLCSFSMNLLSYHKVLIFSFKFYYDRYI